MNNINDKIIKVWGASIIEPDAKLNLGDDVTVTVKGNVYQINEKDNQDGTKDMIYIIKQITSSVMITHEYEHKESTNKK